jgi:hypothetical protein
MNYKIYIQALNNFPIDDWAVSAYIGFKQRQADIYFFEHIDEVPVERSVILVASIENTNIFFERLGLPPKQSINIPDCLREYAGRKIEHLTVGEFLTRRKYPVFVKPDGKSKEFVAGVVSSEKYLFFFESLPKETKCMTSEVIDILSEYRCYVTEGELKGIKHYQGDFRIFPDVKVIENAIKDYTNAPAGYTIDFGVTHQGTVLIEVNDGFSIGNYGLEHSTYVTLLCKRWLEIMRTS